MKVTFPYVVISPRTNEIKVCIWKLVIYDDNMLQSNEVSGVTSPKISRLIWTKIWCADFISSFKIYEVKVIYDPRNDNYIDFIGPKLVTIIDDKISNTIFNLN